MLDKIKEIFSETIEELDLEFRGGEFTEDMVLLESGLDSLGFAILVAKLDDELGFDPFVQMEEPVYPVTFGEFVKLYETCSQ